MEKKKLSDLLATLIVIARCSAMYLKEWIRARCRIWEDCPPGRLSRYLSHFHPVPLIADKHTLLCSHLYTLYTSKTQTHLYIHHEPAHP